MLPNRQPQTYFGNFAFVVAIQGRAVDIVKWLLPSNCKH